MSMNPYDQETHFVCAKHLRELGGKAPCCECSGGKDCSFIGTEEDLKRAPMEEEKDTSWEERFEEKFAKISHVSRGECAITDITGTEWQAHVENGKVTEVGGLESIKDFIRQEREAVEEKVRREFGEHSEAIYSHRREALLREVSELIKKKEREIPKAKKGDYDAMLANLNQQHINIGYNQAITEVQNIIKNKI